MKKAILGITLSLFALSASAQKLKESELPQAVKDAFKKTHAEVKKVEWEKEGANYEAEFEVGETETSIVMDANGALLETEIEIKIYELPATITDYVSKNYKGSKIKEAAKITDLKGNISYETEVNDKDLIFDSNGKLIKEERN
jgi:hypothetical protein